MTENAELQAMVFLSIPQKSQLPNCKVYVLTELKELQDTSILLKF